MWDEDLMIEVASTCADRQVSCVTEQMATRDAPAAAVEFFRENGLFLADVQRLTGPLALATTLDPWLANGNTQLAIVGGTPAFVPVPAEVDRARADLQIQPGFVDFLALAPEMYVDASATTYLGWDVTDRGLIEVLFLAPMVNGCRACPSSFATVVTLSYLTDGTFQAATVEDLCQQTASRLEGDPPLSANPCPTPPRS